ncbi:hypothetical protein [Salsipaludibacter albus]|uniref:hypothetical protein n=1 Tax=Salsipaludibacter albus TaxID=2849650 RepID=UPI001EE466EA|nr:hypothetical protein [Salsipaludibacter albus]MBY5162884.1 hypothetical protein [Salsipaludibacter albus]
MRTLLGQQFAPTTSSIGFVERPLDEATAALAQWRRDLYPKVEVSRRRGFPGVLHLLEPLTGGSRPRELLIDVGEWTAYFDNGLRGTDAVSAIGVLSRRLGCQGLAVRAGPYTADHDGSDLRGPVQFELFGPLPTEFLNYVRTISVAFDGTRWRFDATGTQQRFEQPEAYRASRIHDRFTSEMLERYCQALGVDVFNPEAYGPEAILTESQVPLAPDGRVMTLREAQAWLGITPDGPSEPPG